MSMEEVERFLNNFLVALQLALGVWQFMKLTPIGALIQGVIGAYLLRPFRLSKTYGRLLRDYDGRIFKRANCYVLQPDIPSERTIVRNESDTIHLYYFGTKTILQRRGSEKNMLFIDDKMCYYIVPTVWDELKTLERVFYSAFYSAFYALVFTDAAAAYAAAAADAAAAGSTAAAAADFAVRVADEVAVAAAVAAAPNFAPDPSKLAVCADTSVAYADAVYEDTAASSGGAVAAAVATAAAAAADSHYPGYNGNASGSRFSRAAFVEGRREFWEEVITGGVMELEEILDRTILDNQRVSLRLSDEWLLPVNLSVSEEKLLKILNLIGLFLQTRKIKVHWLFPTSLSFVSALLEFSTKLRIRLYSKINEVFCYIVHFICDRLPRSWRRQVYSLGKYVENIKPGNDIDLKIIRGNVCAIIAGSAKVEREGSLVPWLNVADEDNEIIKKQFRCDPIDIECHYFVRVNMCRISAPKISDFYVRCRSKTDFKQIITLVSCITEKRCGSLKSYGPNGKVCVRGFKESVISYVKNGCPSIYELELEDVVVT